MDEKIKIELFSSFLTIMWSLAGKKKLESFMILFKAEHQHKTEQAISQQVTDRHQVTFSLLTPTGQMLGAHGEEKSRCSSTA